MSLKHLTGPSQKLLQFEVIALPQCHPKPFRLPFGPPQDILAKASWPGTHVSKVQQLVSPYQGLLHH